MAGRPWMLEPVPQVVERACGAQYQEMDAMVSKTPNLCSCGTFAIGVCASCKAYTCGLCSTQLDGRRVCTAHIIEDRAKREQETLEAARREAELAETQRREQEVVDNTQVQLSQQDAFAVLYITTGPTRQYTISAKNILRNLSLDDFTHVAIASLRSHQVPTVHETRYTGNRWSLTGRALAASMSMDVWWITSGSGVTTKGRWVCRSSDGGSPTYWALSEGHVKWLIDVDREQPVIPGRQV